MRKVWKLMLAFCMLSSVVTTTSVKAATSKIDIAPKNLSAKGDSSKPITNIVDGDINTYWQSMNHNGEGNTSKEQLITRMEDHNRYIDIVLDATYDISDIKVFNRVDGSYSNYYIYASEDGSTYNKVVSKTDNKLATADGDHFSVTTRAAYLRINMAYNSNSYETNLAELELYGSKYSSDVKKADPITVTSWEDSEWKSEWDKVEQDTQYANAKTIKEMSNLVERVVGSEWVPYFTFELRSDMDGEDVFEISNHGNGVLIKGNNGVALASGFNYYLKNYAMVDYNPLFASNTTMPDKFVPVDKTIVKTTQYDYRYALNFCTYSYTMAFWNWDQYEAFIDWAAMNGVNLMLDIVGQEEVLRELLSQYNYSDDEIKDYISGPAYFAWFYMQNLYSFGGPLPDDWFAQRVELGRIMHDRMQTYGIQPVIQGFSGQVPQDFADKNEGAVLTPIDEWPTFTRPAIVSPYLTDKNVADGKVNYFSEMAKKFYDAEKNVFGDVSDYYAADPFHEGGKTEGLDMSKIYAQVQTEMLNSNENAIWVMQQWQGNLNDAKLGGLVKPSQALALDLQADLNPEHGVMENNKVPWIWNMLHNFGGRMGLDGELSVTASKMPQDYQNNNYMVGIGITPEALENSPVAYELMFDMTWSKDPIDEKAWLEKYAERRAGGNSESLQEAWKILNETAYAEKGTYFQGAAETVINARPGTSFTSASTWGHSTIQYDKTKLDQALQLLINNYDEFKSSPAYTYDLADVAEQVLCNAAVEYHSLMATALNDRNSEQFKQYSQKFLEIIELSDKILASDEEFMVGTWINDARTMLDNADDWTKDLFEFNARALITTWGGERSSSLNDYSNRKWAGLTQTYYGERWKMWIANRQAELDGTEKNPEYVKAESNWFLWGWKWVNQKSDDGFEYTTTANAENLKEYAQLAFDSYSVTELEKSGGSVNEKVNIAKGKLFTTASSTKGGELANLTDESTGTFWEGEGAGPHTLTLDLEGLYQISDMSIAIRQAAGDYPMDYTIEYMDENGEWQEYEKQIGGIMQSNTNIAKSVQASSIRLTMETRDYGNFSVYIAEVYVYGTPVETTSYINIAEGKPATATIKTDENRPLSNITDNNTSSDNIWAGAWSDNKDEMYPATVTIDLQGAAKADFIELYLEKAGLPYQFTVEIENAKGEKTVVLDESKTVDVLNTRTFKIPLDEKEVAKVYINFVGRTDQGEFYAASPAISECKVLAKEAPVTLKNYAYNKPVKVSSINHYEKPSPEYITDGNKNTVWSYDGDTDGDSGYAEIDLQGTYEIKTIDLTFKKEPYTKYYIFDVIAVTEENEEKVIYSETGANKTSYTLNVNDRISKIKVVYKGKSQASDGWFDIAELEAYGVEESSQESDVNFGDGTALKLTTNEAYQKTIDGDKTTFIANIQDQEIVYDLGGSYYVDHADFTFEKGELGLKYIIYAENAQGERTLVLDRSNTKQLLGDATISVNVNQVANKIIFKHLGNNGNGPAYLAEARLYETEIYGGTPKNAALNASVDPEAAKTIVDGDLSTIYEASKDEVITMKFATSKDVNLFSLVNDQTKAGSYIIEVFNIDKNAWEVVYDGSDSVIKKENIISTPSPIFTNQVRLTIKNDSLNINEFNAYEVDTTGPLSAYIEELNTILEEKKYDDVNGSYTLEAKEAMEAKIAEAEKAIADGLNSAAVTEWMTTLEKALNNFYQNGLVYIHRDGLLNEMSYTNLIMDELRKEGKEEDAAKFKEAYAAAKTVYDTYLVTQEELDQAAATLKQKTEEILASIQQNDAKERYELQLAIAERVYEESVVGVFEGQYTQESKDDLAKEIADVKKAYETADLETIDTLITRLQNAVEDFKASVNVVDRSSLLEMINRITDLHQSDYDIDTWKELQNALTVANEAYGKEQISQDDINQAQQNLKVKMEALVKLDRSGLREVLDQVTQLDKVLYTKESWEALQKVNKSAIESYNSDTTTQTKIDEAKENLKKAMEALEEKKADIPDEPQNIVLPSQNDNKITVEGKFEDASLTFVADKEDEKTVKEITSKIDQTFLKNHAIEEIYDLYLLKDDERYQLDGKAVVRIPLSKELKEKTLKVIYIADDGSIQMIDSVVQGNELIFSIEHLSHYAIVSEFVPQDQNQPKPDNPNNENNSGSNNGTNGNNNGSNNNANGNNNGNSQNQESNNSVITSASVKDGNLYIAIMSVILIAGMLVVWKKRKEQKQ